MFPRGQAFLRRDFCGGRGKTLTIRPVDVTIWEKSLEEIENGEPVRLVIPVPGLADNSFLYRSLIVGERWRSKVPGRFFLLQTVAQESSRHLHLYHLLTRRRNNSYKRCAW